MKKLLFIICVSLLMFACKYKTTYEKVEQLKIGMSKDQAKELLGKPNSEQIPIPNRVELTYEFQHLNLEYELCVSIANDTVYNFVTYKSW